MSPVAVDLARRDASAAGLDEIRYAQRDVFAEEPLPACDVVMCTLFLHHLTASHAELLVRRMATAATRLVLIDDLVRTRDGYLLAWVGSRILSRSPVVHADGPQSVRAAFSLSELQQIAKQSGLDGATIERHWPQRMLLTWERPA